MIVNDTLKLEGTNQITTLSINDLPTGGSIGLASDTVDKYTYFEINQNTASQDITIPNPTEQFKAKIIIISNTGGESFTVFSDITVPTQSQTILFWSPFNTTWAFLSAKALANLVFNWVGSSTYRVGDYVLQDGRLLQANQNFFSEATFDATEATRWNLLQVGPTKTFTGGKYYYADEEAILGTRTLKRISNGVADGAFTNTEAALWTLISNDVPSAWSPVSYVYGGELITNNSVTYQRTSSGVTGGSFNAAEASNYTVAGFTGTPAWTSLTYFPAGQEIAQNGLRYQRQTAGISGISFDSGELANWRKIGEDTVGTTTTITGATYTLQATDGVVVLNPAGLTQNITLNSSLPDQKDFAFAWTVDNTKTITFTAGAGTTIANPLSGAIGASWSTTDNGGITNGTPFFIRHNKANNIWYFST